MRKVNANAIGIIKEKKNTIGHSPMERHLVHVVANPTISMARKLKLVANKP